MTTVLKSISRDAPVLRTLYPAIKPYAQTMLPVDNRHTLYVEECGNRDGTPVIYLHGGPGGGCAPMFRRFFDPDRWRIILFDQRGCGRSTPHADLTDNTTWHLVEDMETIRNHLSIETWSVFGGSWGSCLALAYAQTHPKRVRNIILRGLFALRRKELQWFYQEGASAVFPDAWEHFIAPIPEAERDDLMAAYYKRLTGNDTEEQLRCARAWSVWEGSTLSLYANPAREAEFADARYALAFARIECHYFVNGGFFDHDDQIIANLAHIRHIPATLVQGRYDMCTPMRTAWDIHKAWPEADFQIIADAGHASGEPGITHALINATDSYA